MGFHDRTEWVLQIINGRTGEPVNDDSGIYNAMKDGDPTLETIYAQQQDSSSVTQNGASPPVFSNGRARWFTDPDITVIDFSYLTANGECGFMKGITPSNHRIVIWPETVDYRATTNPVCSSEQYEWIDHYLRQYRKRGSSGRGLYLCRIS